MVFRFVSVFALLAAANAGNLIQPAVYSSHAIATPLSYAHSSVGSTQENVVRSFAGTVSQYSKAVDTPFSSVRKTDTRVNNNVYTPTYPAAPALTYAAPVAKTYVQSSPLTYAAPVAKTFIQPAPLAYAAPVAKTLVHQTPLTYATPVAKTYIQPASLPVTKTLTYAAPVAKIATPISYSAAPALLQAPLAKTVIHQGPLTYASPIAKTFVQPAALAQPIAKIATPVGATAYTTKTISYSPAAQVAHVNFDGFGAHYEW
ncbi:hypothetical protein ACFFRR_005165 [Megaselia abdita]